MSPSPDPLLRLLAWASPAMPTGGFSYSHGLEAAIEHHLVSSQADLLAYVEAALRMGSGRNDAILLTVAFRARGERELVAALETAAALPGSAEFALESGAQGVALLRTLRTAWPDPRLDQLHALTRDRRVEPAYPVVMGVAASCHGVPMPSAVLALLHGFAALIISAGVRLIPLGQTAGQRLTSMLEPTIEEVAREALESTLDDLGSAAPVIDLLSMGHESQTVRLFRS